MGQEKSRGCSVRRYRLGRVASELLPQLHPVKIGRAGDPRACGSQVALRALQQVYAATHPAAFIEPGNAPPLPAAKGLWPGDPAAEALAAALERDALEDHEETGD